MEGRQTELPGHVASERLHAGSQSINILPNDFNTSGLLLTSVARNNWAVTQNVSTTCPPYSVDHFNCTRQDLPPVPCYPYQYDTTLSDISGLAGSLPNYITSSDITGALTGQREADLYSFENALQGPQDPLCLPGDSRLCNTNDIPASDIQALIQQITSRCQLPPAYPANGTNKPQYANPNDFPNGSADKLDVDLYPDTKLPDNHPQCTASNNTEICIESACSKPHADIATQTLEETVCIIVSESAHKKFHDLSLSQCVDASSLLELLVQVYQESQVCVNTEKCDKYTNTDQDTLAVPNELHTTTLNGLGVDQNYDINKTFVAFNTTTGGSTAVESILKCTASPVTNVCSDENMVNTTNNAGTVERETETVEAEALSLKDFISPSFGEQNSNDESGCHGSSIPDRTDGEHFTKEDGVYLCKICAKYKTKTQKVMKIHIRTHTGERPYKCDNCTAMFKQRSHLVKHLKSQHSKGQSQVQCPSCTEEFSSVKKLKEHQECFRCSSSTAEENLGTENSSKGEKTGKKNNKILPGNRSQRNSKWEDKSVHQSTTVGGECGNKSPKKNMLRGKNGKKSRGNKQNGITGKQPSQLVCDICGLIFSSSSKLQHHVALHSDPKPYKCSQCNYETPYLSNLCSHRRMHMERKQFVCEQCGREFRHKGQLKAHQSNKHTVPGKLYTCRHCVYSSASSQSFNSHMRKHKARTTNFTQGDKVTARMMPQFEPVSVESHGLDSNVDPLITSALNTVPSDLSCVSNQSGLLSIFPTLGLSLPSDANYQPTTGVEDGSVGAVVSAMMELGGATYPPLPDQSTCD